MPTVTINSLPYFYRSCRQVTSHQPALILLHGSGGDSSIWDAQIEALADERLVIAPDLPGHGKSHKKPAETLNEYAEWLKQLIAALNVPSCILVGHSMGGAIALQCAHKFPEILQGLVLIGTGMHFDIPSGYLKLIRDDFHSACLMSCKEAYASEPVPALVERGLSMLRNNGPDVLLRDLLLCDDFNSSAWAHKLTMPCLVMCGEMDTITPRALSEELASTVPNSMLTTFEESGHMVMQEKPGECNNEISSFVRSYFNNM